jgi:hypothetical protein
MYTLLKKVRNSGMDLTVSTRESLTIANDSAIPACQVSFAISFQNRLAIPTTNPACPGCANRASWAC